jgi:hypothetical protein
MDGCREQRLSTPGHVPERQEEDRLGIVASRSSGHFASPAMAIKELIRARSGISTLTTIWMNSHFASLGDTQKAAVNSSTDSFSKP